ncbi:BTAD domain-containing putative transcriptional regulator [Streptomyces sp. NBC_00878]|uniref:AfsR/SARP family transcriptional regulator n=1 Tax=Streptomyces sp. NBC_00878 TaxID=2975854 RepID=UPI00225928CF|nr:BTAD domain-containing putative transcriptional regulator [Streptomyces sp. NBC_00878]
MAALRFSLLGPLRAWRGTDELELGSPQQRAVLAMLLLRRGQAVGVADFVDGIWGAQPPEGAVPVLRTYISRLRKLLEPERPSGQPSDLLVSIGDGYALRTGTLSSDLDDFGEAVAQAERRRATGDGQSAVRLLRTVLAAGEGTALAGVPGPYAEAARDDLAERRLSALELALRIELEVGRHEALVPELLTLRDAHPLREAMSELLLIALYRCGRQAEALAVYTRTRRILVEELGIEPGPSLRAVHERILAGDPALGRPTPSGPAGGPVGGRAAPAGSGPEPRPEPDNPAPVRGTGAVRPFQLPADPPLFAGRRAQLHCAKDLLPDGDGPPDTAVIGVVDGMAGTGKTTIAVHWAHRIAHRFPDGCLYVNLRGFDPAGSWLAPGDAIEMFLDALGVAPQSVPESLDAQAALYRSVLADRRVLIVLDNARDTEQVRPLLPGTPGSLVIVTSRSRLSGLIAGHGAQLLTLDLLTAEESLELLTRRLGAARVGAEPEAANAIVDLCARLPLALAIVAARAAHHPAFRLADIVEGLRDDHGSLDAFSVGDDAGTDIRAVFSWSYHALSPEAAGLFRRLTLHPGPDISAAAATALAGVPSREGRALLAELTGASLVIERAPGRFVFHDLLRAYGCELTTRHDSASERDAALLRMHDHYLHTAHHASAVLGPFRETVPVPPSRTGSGPLRFNDAKQATTWLRTERHVLRAIVEHAADRGYPDHAWRTAYALDLFCDRLGYRHDLMEINKAALRAAQDLGDPVGQAHSLRGLGFCHTRFDHADEASRLLGGALELFRKTGDAFGQARTRRGLAFQANRLGRHDVALEHYEQAAELYRSLGHISGEASVLNEVGWTYILRGDAANALEYCEKAVALQQEVGDLNGEASALDSVGYAHHHLGQYGPAVEHFERAVELYRQLDNRYMEADTLRHLGDAHRAAHDHGSARAAWAAALALLEEGGHTETDDVRRALRELDSLARDQRDQ